ncbi:MAG: hypothetical protein SOU51_07290 [Collinsella sp.]|nr:hypothetical protein [Collinsella sp.]
MALYLPHRHIAIDIIDDPCSAPVDREAFPGFSVIALSMAQLVDIDLGVTLVAAADGCGTDDVGPRRAPMGPARGEGAGDAR